MDGENNGKPYEQMDDLEVPLFLETPIYIYILYDIFGFQANLANQLVFKKSHRAAWCIPSFFYWEGGQPNI